MFPLYSSLFPELSNLPKTIVANGALGFAYGIVANTNPKLAACAFAMTALFNTLLFAIANPLFGGDLRKKSVFVSLVTRSVVMITAIVAFQRLQLIAELGLAMMSVYELRVFSNRCIFFMKLKEV
jgi:hypothetical protein